MRRQPVPSRDVLDRYTAEVVPVLDRAEWLYQHWYEQTSLFSDGEKLGNVAAIHRWETATMGRSVEQIDPPAELAEAHADALAGLDLASRAAQLLSSGSRFHNAGALCEGQILLEESRRRRLRVLETLRRYYASHGPREHPPSAAPPIGATAPTPETAAGPAPSTPPATEPAIEQVAKPTAEPGQQPIRAADGPTLPTTDPSQPVTPTADGSRVQPPDSPAPPR
ncbi:MAG: hypothetical protein IT305_21705 [Chloroflexi bacterium]|nr:hypothetical protein [Chloroflexota bacterium]